MTQQLRTEVLETAHLSRLVIVSWNEEHGDSLDTSVQVGSGRVDDGTWSTPSIHISALMITAQSWPRMRLAIDEAFRVYEERFQ